MRRGTACVAVGLLLAAAAGCTPTPRDAPAADSRPTTAASISATTTGNPGYRPNDPLAAIADAVASVRQAGTGTLIETRRMLAEDAEIVMTVETTFQLSPYRTENRVSLTGLGSDAEVTFGQRDGVMMIKAPTEWGDGAGTWYRLLELDEGLLADQLPSYALTALSTAAPPGWVSAGNADSDTVTYEVTVTQRAAVDLLLPQMAEAALKVASENEVALNDPVPAKVTVAADGALRQVIIDASSPAALAVGELGSFEFETFPRPFEYHSTLDVVSLGGPVDITLPAPDTLPEMPELPESIAGLIHV